MMAYWDKPSINDIMFSFDANILFNNTNKFNI